MEEILESFYNGQFRQMVEQIDKFGVYDFVNELENYDLPFYKKYDVLKFYLRIKNR